jgi:hypothetical protein
MRSIRIDNLEQIADVKADSKNRISLGRKVKLSARHYRVFHDASSGRIILEPLAVVPLSEPWLDSSPKAKSSVERGQADAKAGRLVNASEDYSKYVEKE